jgi:hypothetical protein
MITNRRADRELLMALTGCLSVSPGRTISTRSEESDDHPVVARLNAEWRIIVCAAGLQWILQRGYRAKNHGDMRWRSRGFCRTSEALIRVSRLHAGAVDQAASAILAALPERIEQPAMTHSPRRREPQTSNAVSCEPDGVVILGINL